MNLYSLLGVARDATKDAIRRAFRQKVKQAHPDAGGDPVAFTQLCLAHDVLIDEERRETYDSTGSTEPPLREDYLRQYALALLAELIKTILTVETDSDPNRANLVSVGTEHLEKAIQRLEKQLAAVHKAQQRAQGMRGRWKAMEGDQPNILESIVTSQDSFLAQSETNIRGQIEGHRIAIDILQDHRFQYDVACGVVRTDPFYRIFAQQ